MIMQKNVSDAGCEGISESGPPRDAIGERLTNSVLVPSTSQGSQQHTQFLGLLLLTISKIFDALIGRKLLCSSN